LEDLTKKKTANNTKGTVGSSGKKTLTKASNKKIPAIVL
jgi:hypothetical protein